MKIVWYFISLTGSSVLHKAGYKSIFKYIFQPLSQPKLNRRPIASFHAKVTLCQFYLYAEIKRVIASNAVSILCTYF